MQDRLLLRVVDKVSRKVCTGGICAIIMGCIDKPQMEVDLHQRMEVGNDAVGELPADMVFASSWSHGGIGTSEVAVTDSGRWTGGGEAFEVALVQGSGLAFPTSNMLVVTPVARESGGAETAALRTNGLPIPEPGESLYFRQYWAMGVPDAWIGDDRSTSVRDGSSGSKNWSQEVINEDGSWALAFNVPAPWPNNRWQVTGLAKNTVYRIEWRVSRVSEATFNLEARVYDEASALVFESRDFVNVNGSATLADAPPPGLTVDAEEAFSYLQLGVVGINSGDSWGWPYARIAGYCVRTMDWCGAFNPLEESMGEEPPAQTPDAPAVTSSTATDTSVIVTSSEFGGMEGDSHDSTVWRIRDASSSSLVWADTTADSLTSFGGEGAGASLPLASGVAYLIDVKHHGAESGWSEFGDAAAFTTTSADTSHSKVVLFHSDWSTATGTSDAALRDTGKTLPWTDTKASAGGTEIVTSGSTGMTWPTGMANVMRIMNLAAGSPNQGVRLVDAFTPPSVGQTLYYRAYFANTTPDSYTGDSSIHPWQDGPAGGNANNWWWVVESTSGGTWRPEFHITTADASLGDGAQIVSWVLGRASRGNGAIELAKDSVYGFEFAMEIVGANAWHPHARVYDVNGNILYDDSDWHRGNGNGDTLADLPTFRLYSLTNTASMQLGSNGWSVDPPQNYQAFLWGGMAICLNDWCGPYQNGR